MLKKLQTLWLQQSAKDQIYLLIGAAAIGVFLLWIGLLQPLTEWREQEQRRAASLAQTLSTVESLVDRIQRQTLQGVNNADDNSLAEVIDASLRDSNLRMKGFQPNSNGEALLYLEDASYPLIIQWLYDLEYSYGVQILELNLVQTQTAGVLKASLTVASY